MALSNDHLSIRTFLEEVREAGSYDDGIRKLCRRFAARKDVQNLGYLYRSFLKRNPESLTAAQRPFRGLEAELRAVTSSAEFKQNFGVHVLDEFRDLRRELFIHIPKTGGNSVLVRAAQDPRFVVVRSPLGPTVDIPDWPKYYYHIACRLFSNATHILVHYHLQIQHAVAFRLLRPQDQIYTIVRDPVSLMISYLNYVLTRVATSVGDPTPPYGISDMRRAMGFGVDQELGSNIDEAVLVSILGNYIPKNPMCNCLGATDADTAYDNLYKFGIKVYDMIALKDLFAGYSWEYAHENMSNKYISAEMLSDRTLYQLHAMSYEDLLLYERLKSDGVVGAARS